jgi:hypothetical protein
MERVEIGKAQTFQFLTTPQFRFSRFDQDVCILRQPRHPSPAVWISHSVDLKPHRPARDQVPVTCLCMRQDAENCLRLKAHAILRLIVVGPVQAANIEVYSESGRGRSRPGRPCQSTADRIHRIVTDSRSVRCCARMFC